MPKQKAAKKIYVKDGFVKVPNELASLIVANKIPPGALSYYVLMDLYCGKLTNFQAASLMGCHRHSIRRWKQTLEENGFKVRGAHEAESEKLRTEVKKSGPSPRRQAPTAQPSSTVHVGAYAQAKRAAMSAEEWEEWQNRQKEIQEGLPQR